jgi:hypothetical protein
MSTAGWIPMSTNTHSEYVILVDFLLQQWLHEHASMLCKYVHCLSCLFYCYVLFTLLKWASFWIFWRIDFILRHKIYHMYRHSSSPNYQQNYFGGKVYWSGLFVSCVCVCNTIWRKWFFYSKIIISEVQIWLPNFLQLWLHVPWTWNIKLSLLSVNLTHYFFQWLTPGFCQLTSMFLTTKHYALLNPFLAAVDMIHAKSEFFPPAAVSWPCCYK